MDYNFNKYQTPLTDELLQSLPKRVSSNLINYIDNVQFIKNLISPNRKTVKEAKKDEDGKVIVDVTNPHIVENMDYFRQAAIHFKKHGCYTNLYPSKNPTSDYYKFWKEEERRWKEGFAREDGEWVTGHHYFYLNYSPILITRIKNKTKSTKDRSKIEGERIKDFPDFWLGDYLFFHYIEQAIKSGSHAKLLKARGMGFSYKLASISPRNMYIFPGQPNFHIASDKTYLLGEKGVYGKVVNCLDHIGENTPFSKLRAINKPLEKQLGYKDEYGIVKGLKSSAYGISIKDNPDKARGVRGPLIHYEEDGIMPNFEKAWNINRKAVEDGNIVYGLMLAGGTGGTEGADFEGSEKLFYNPHAYNIYGIPNVFDLNASGQSNCSFFWGAYMNRALCYNEDGEPDVIKALIEIISDRDVVIKASSDPKTITQKKAEEPIVPQEAVMRVDGTLFPVSDLKDILSEIMPNIKSFISEHWCGKLILNKEGKIKWTNEDSTVIRDYPIKDNLNKEGGIEIFEPPIKNGKGEIPWGRYIAGCDPYDDDHSQTTSLGSTFIFDLLTDRIVAEYTGRPKTAVQYYENVLRLLMYYNAELNYENDKKGLFSYFDRRHALQYLCDTPQILRDMEYMKYTPYGNKSKGTGSGVKINAWGRRLQVDWMFEQAYGEEDGILNMHTIRSIGYLKEAVAWNIDGNFDRVSAMGMLMILREEKAKYQLYLDDDKESNKEEGFWNNYRFGRKNSSIIFKSDRKKNMRELLNKIK